MQATLLENYEILKAPYWDTVRLTTEKFKRLRLFNLVTACEFHTFKLYSGEKQVTNERIYSKTLQL